MADLEKARFQAPPILNIFWQKFLGLVLGFHMRYHFFLYQGWFPQNLGKDFIHTNMHTTVAGWMAVGHIICNHFSKWFEKSGSGKVVRE